VKTVEGSRAPILCVPSPSPQLTQAATTIRWTAEIPNSELIFRRLQPCCRSFCGCALAGLRPRSAVIGFPGGLRPEWAQAFGPVRQVNRSRQSKFVKNSPPIELQLFC
jgi:hypothetical protein